MPNSTPGPRNRITIIAKTILSKTPDSVQFHVVIPFPRARRRDWKVEGGRTLAGGRSQRNVEQKYLSVGFRPDLRIDGFDECCPGLGFVSLFCGAGACWVRGEGVVEFLPRRTAAWSRAPSDLGRLIEVGLDPRLEIERFYWDHHGDLYISAADILFLCAPLVGAFLCYPFDIFDMDPTPPTPDNCVLINPCRSVHAIPFGNQSALASSLLAQ